MLNIVVNAPGQLLAAAQPAQVTGNRAALWIRLSGNRATLSSRMSVHTNPGLMCLSGVCTDKNTCSSAAVLKLHGSHGTSAPASCALMIHRLFLCAFSWRTSPSQISEPNHLEKKKHLNNCQNQFSYLYK